MISLYPYVHTYSRNTNNNKFIIFINYLITYLHGDFSKKKYTF